MIHFDITKAGAAGHQSGLMRVSARLSAALGPRTARVNWPEGLVGAAPDDWLLTAELFSEQERPGVTAFLARRPCRCAAVFHDAIPLRWPHITWPQSVARQAGYMKLLAQFDRVWAVSRASQADLEGFWRWQGLTRTPPVSVLPLGADFDHSPRCTSRPLPPTPPRLLCVGILEPRKNQGLLLEACDVLWNDGVRFELHLVGRVNPHFGGPILAQIKAISRRHRGAVYLHRGIDDAKLVELYQASRASVFPTLAEGCGLPLLEALWKGVPCVCSDLPVLSENAPGGGCLPVPVNDCTAWVEALRCVLTDDSLIARLTQEAMARPLPTWAEAAAQVTAELLKLR